MRAGRSQTVKFTWKCPGARILHLFAIHGLTSLWFDYFSKWVPDLRLQGTVLPSESCSRMGLTEVHTFVTIWGPHWFAKKVPIETDYRKTHVYNIMKLWCTIVPEVKFGYGELAVFWFSKRGVNSQASRGACKMKECHAKRFSVAPIAKKYSKKWFPMNFYTFYFFTNLKNSSSKKSWNF